MNEFKIKEILNGHIKKIENTNLYFKIMLNYIIIIKINNQSFEIPILILEDVINEILIKYDYNIKIDSFVIFSNFKKFIQYNNKDNKTISEILEIIFKDIGHISISENIKKVVGVINMKKNE